MPAHRHPWNVLRQGRPVEVADDGRRFYRDAHGDPVYEWPDEECPPEVLADWDEALIRQRIERWRHGNPRPLRRGR